LSWWLKTRVLTLVLKLRQSFKIERMESKLRLEFHVLEAASYQLEAEVPQAD
jgi:hypothetical protein